MEIHNVCDFKIVAIVKHRNLLAIRIMRPSNDRKPEFKLKIPRLSPAAHAATSTMLRHPGLHQDSSFKPRNIDSRTNKAESRQLSCPCSVWLRKGRVTYDWSSIKTNPARQHGKQRCSKTVQPSDENGTAFKEHHSMLPTSS